MTVTLLYFSGCAVFYRPSLYKAPDQAPSSPYRGVVHVHSVFSGDSKASLKQIIKTAQKAKLDFVVITDHNNVNGLKAYQRMEKPEWPMLIFGEEISTPNGHLVSLMEEDYPDHLQSSQEIITWIHAKGGYCYTAHPIGKRTPWTDWNLSGIDAIELYNFGHTLKESSKAKIGSTFAFSPPKSFVKQYQYIPEKNFKFWHERLLKSKTAAIAAPDAHIHQKWMGWSPESLLMMFQASTMYVHSDNFSPELILKGLAKGHSFIAFETRGIAKDFRFTAKTGNRNYAAGETIQSELPIDFVAQAPQEGLIRIIRNGERVAEQKGKQLSYSSEIPGYYRAEVYKGDDLWIVSNPIYVDE